VRSVLLVPVYVVVIAVACCAAAAATGAAGQVRQIAAAAAVTALASALAAVPMLLVRGADQPSVVQAALASTGAHMLLTLALAGGAWAAGLAAFAPALLGWLLVFYWLSLAVLAVALVRVVRSARRQ